MTTGKNLGLVLTGGGARGAYQAGVLRGLAEIAGPGPSPFKVLTGTSAGAINAAYLAQASEDFTEATRGLVSLWSDLNTDRVFKTSAYALVLQGLRVMRNLFGGGILHQPGRNHLLNTEPLTDLIRGSIDFARVRANLDNGVLKAVGITTTHYHSGASITHYDARGPVREWDRGNHLSLNSDLRPEHVLASAAIPIFFAPVALNDSFHGDGSMRLTSPFRPAIHLGSDRILAISVRHLDPADSVRERAMRRSAFITLADIAGTLLNAVFLDAIDMDKERMERINRTLGLLTDEQRSHMPDALRICPVKLIRPSRDLGKMAAQHLPDLPPTMRYLFRGLGARKNKSADILSYLAFEGAFCKQLVDLGREDVMAQRRELEEFLGLG